MSGFRHALTALAIATAMAAVASAGSIRFVDRRLSRLSYALVIYRELATAGLAAAEDFLAAGRRLLGLGDYDAWSSWPLFATLNRRFRGRRRRPRT